jgi:hypothetical protein
MILHQEIFKLIEMILFISNGQVEYSISLLDNIKKVNLGSNTHNNQGGGDGQAGDDGEGTDGS